MTDDRDDPSAWPVAPLTTKEIIKRPRKLAEAFRVTRGRDFRLKDVDPADTLWLKKGTGREAREVLQSGIHLLAALQDRLFAGNRWSVVLIFQAMDAAGKDSAIKHVMSGVNPQGCQVFSFKAPTPHELDHDFFWRCATCLPERGRIGVFNRSYYEETLVVRVHQELLEKQKLPDPVVSKQIWDERFEDINDFERHLTRNGTVLLKFFLHLSKREQKRRFLARLEVPEKNWKFSPSDIRERAFWDDYMHAYEQMVRNTATKHAPWYVIPADNKWFTRLVVAACIIEVLDRLDLRYPEVSETQRKGLIEAKRLLLAER